MPARVEHGGTAQRHPVTAQRLAAVALAVAVGLGVPRVASAQVEDGTDSVSVRAVPARAVVRPGDLVPIAVVFDHAEGFHSWPNTPVVPPVYRDVIPIPTAIEVTASSSAAAGRGRLAEATQGSSRNRSARMIGNRP